MAGPPRATVTQASGGERDRFGDVELALPKFSAHPTATCRGISIFAREVQPYDQVRWCFDIGKASKEFRCSSMEPVDGPRKVGEHCGRR
jgi:hypothetical protein